MAKNTQPERFKTALRIIGVLGKDPELTYTTKGTAIANFTMCHNTGKRGEPNNKSIWFNCVAFGELAEHIRQYYGKGSAIRILEATPDQDKWEYKGKPMSRDKWKVWQIEDEKLGTAPVGEPQQYDGPGFPPTQDDDIPY